MDYGQGQEKRPKKIIGIVGGIGSGKSTAAAEFEKLGCAVISADAIVHKLLEEDKKIIMQIKDAFGAEVITKKGVVNRSRLAKRVFSSEENVRKINEIIHPAVFEKCQELIEKYKSDAKVKAIVLDMPLLVETGWDKQCDAVVFVDCPEAKRKAHAEKRGLDWEKIVKIRENFQISLDIKLKTAKYIVYNNSDLSVLTEQVKRIFTTIMHE